MLSPRCMPVSVYLSLCSTYFFRSFMRSPYSLSVCLHIVSKENKRLLLARDSSLTSDVQTKQNKTNPMALSPRANYTD
jgi:hypothetical protein